MGNFLEQALLLHDQVPVVDTHSHFLLAGHYLSKRFSRRHTPPWFWNPLRNVVDLPRLKEGKVSCSTFTVYVPPPPFRLSAWKACQRILGSFRKVLENPQITQVRTAAEIRAAQKAGTLAALLGVEGGHVIGRKLERLELLAKGGLRLLTLTHFFANRICDAHIWPPVHGGLSAFGREVLKECVRLGVVVDLAHTTEKAFFQALETLDRPPMVTHTGLRMGRRSERHLSEEQVRALAKAGGALGVLMCPSYQEPWGFLGSLDKAADVYAQVADWVGTDHLMIGTDMDGFVWLPRGMRDAADLPKLTAKLLERGFAREDLVKILGGNCLRILEAWETKPS